MIDLHSHILPGLDDGAASLEQAVEMVRIAARCGTTGIVASPHANLRQAVLAAWSRYAEPIGQRVRLRNRGRDYTGTTVAVDPHGGLIVQTDAGRQEWFDPLQTTLL